MPLINQGALPPGIANQSRDDLVLGTTVTISDSGPGAVRAWDLLDRPDGSLAVLSSASGISTSFVPDVEGTYRVRLSVDGGLNSDQVAIVDAAIQIELPAWITALRRKLRVPAWGEELDFNVRSYPDSGLNSRGWAQEVNAFLKTLAANAFGMLVSNAGVQVGSEQKKIDFVNAASVTDLGGGTIQVDVGGGSSSSDFFEYYGVGINAATSEIFIDGVAGNRWSMFPHTFSLLKCFVKALDENTSTIAYASEVLIACQTDAAGTLTVVNYIENVLVYSEQAFAIELSGNAAGELVFEVDTGISSGSNARWYVKALEI